MGTAPFVRNFVFDFVHVRPGCTKTKLWTRFGTKCGSRAWTPRPSSGTSSLTSSTSDPGCTKTKLWTRFGTKWWSRAWSPRPSSRNIVFDFVHVRPRVHQDEALDEVRDEVLEPGVGTAPFVRNIVFDFVHVRSGCTKTKLWTRFGTKCWSRAWVPRPSSGTSSLTSSTSDPGAPRRSSRTRFGTRCWSRAWARALRPEHRL